MLRAFLGDNCEKVVERCRLKAASRGSRRAAPADVAHGVPLSLSHLAEAFADGAPGPEIELRLAKEAAKYGEELVQKGFTIERVVYDYGDLIQSIMELAAERGTPIPATELAILIDRVNGAMASAVAAHSQQHTITVAGESRLAVNERLGKLASEMRNLISTSILAVSAMKRGSVGFGGATAAALDRSMAGMRGLIDRTLAEVREEAGEGPRPEIIEMGPFIAAVQLVAATEIASRGCDLTVVVEPDIFVETDRQVLSGAVSSLLHGSLNTLQRNGHIFLSAHARTGRVLIEVEDSGASLESSALRGILSSFEARACATTPLGWALMHTLKSVEACGGSLSARATAGRGCLYTIGLPAKPYQG